jgi:large subunit ribosomal protein L25
MVNEDKTHALTVKPRDLVGKASGRLSRRRLIPGVVYGYNVKPQNVQVSLREFERTYLRAGSTTLVDLTVGDGGKPQKVFIHDVQRNPLNHAPAHVDFLVVNMRQELTVSVPIVLVGESPVVRSGDGLLLHQTEHLTLKTLPANVPPLIEVDISDLTEIDQAIHVSDISLPENVTLLSSPDDLVVKITEMPVIVEEVEEAEEAAAEIEAEAEGGEEETGESEAESEGGEESES